MGLRPQEIYQMTRREFLIYVKERSLKDLNDSIASSYQTIAFLREALNGKMKPLDDYLDKPAPIKRAEGKAKKEAIESMMRRRDSLLS